MSVMTQEISALSTEFSQQFTLLFVDDEENILKSLRRVFRSESYLVLTALSGKAGLDILRQQRVDLIVSDMRMPEMDGAEFLAKAAAQWPDTMRILLTGFSDMNSTIAAVNQGKIFRYIQKPWEDNDIKLTVQQALRQKALERERDALQKLTREQNEELQDLSVSLAFQVEQRTAELQRAVLKLEGSNDSLKKSYISSVQVFSSLIEMRQGNMAGHSNKVANLGRDIAKHMKLSNEACQSIRVAGLLHDIGKIGFSDEMLSKPFSELSGDELKRYKKHPLEAQAALMALDPLQEAAALIRSHEEQYNGLGYPDGLQKDQIPLGARILAVANDFESLQQGSLVTSKQTREKAIEFIRRNRGKRYDPKVVDAFLEVIGFSNDYRAQGKLQRVPSRQLKPGMVIAKDIVSKSGLMLLSEGHVVTESIVRRIDSYERSMKEDVEIHIYLRGGKQ